MLMMRLEFKVSPAVENIDSTGTLDAQESSSVSLDAGVYGRMMRDFSFVIKPK